MSSLFLVGLGLGRVPRALLPGALEAGVAAGDAEGSVGAGLDGGGDLALLDLLDGDVGGDDGDDGGDGGGLVEAGDVGLGVALLGGVGPAGEEDQAVLVGLEAGDVGGQGFLGEVLAAGVDGDADGAGEGLGDAGLLRWVLEYHFSISDSPRDVKNQDGGIPISYLELSQGETTAGTDSAVVANGRASHNRSELVDGTRSDGSGLGLTSSASSELLAGLYQRSISRYLILRNCAKSRPVALDFLSLSYLVEVGAHPALPILAEICGRSQSLLCEVVVVCSMGRGCSRLLISFWLCLIAWRKKGQRRLSRWSRCIALGGFLIPF